MTWNVVLSHVLRSGSGKSAHYKGNAMDLKVAHYNNGIVVKEVPRASGETNQKELIKAVDILASLHLEEIDQLILEYEKYGDMCSSRSDFYNCLHVGVLNNEKRSVTNALSAQVLLNIIMLRKIRGKLSNQSASVIRLYCEESVSKQ